MQARLIVASVILAVLPAGGQIELKSHLISSSVFTNSARVELESTLPKATGPVCWFDLPFDLLGKPDQNPQVDLSPTTLFNGPARLGEVKRERILTATNLLGLLQCNAGMMVEVGTTTNSFYKGRLELFGDMAMIHQESNRTAAVSQSSIVVLHRLDGELLREREIVEQRPALLATCTATNSEQPAKITLTLPSIRWSPFYELAATASPTTARLTLRARLEGNSALLKETPTTFQLSAGGASWQVPGVEVGSPVLFSEEVACERLIQAMVLEPPEVPVLVHSILRFTNRSDRFWPAAPYAELEEGKQDSSKTGAAEPLGRLMFPATTPGAVAVVTTEGVPPLRVDRRVKEFGRRFWNRTAGGVAREEVTAVGTITLNNISKTPQRVVVLRIAPDVVEEAVPALTEERDAAGGRWLRWEVTVPAGQSLALQCRYRSIVPPVPVKGKESAQNR